MLLVLLTSLAFSAPPDLGRYQVEPWDNYDQSQFLSIFDSAAGRNKKIRISTVQRDSTGKVIVIDTTLYWNRGNQLVMEERHHDIEESPATFSNYQTWMSREPLTTDSSKESAWKDGSLISETSLFTILNGGMQTIRMTSRSQSSSTAETSTQTVNRITIQDGRGRIVSRRDDIVWTSSKAEVLQREELLYQADSIQWDGDVPRTWWENDSGEYYNATPLVRSPWASRTIHHLTWYGTRLLVDSAIVRDDNNDPTKEYIKTTRCTWQDTLLQSCTQNGDTIVEKRHDRFGRPTYLRSDIDNTIYWWTYDSLGRLVSSRVRQMDENFLTADSIVFGEGPWPTRELYYQCDSLGQACRLTSADDYSISYLDVIGVSQRTSRHDRVLVRRSGDILVMTNLPREPGEVRIVDAGGRQLSRTSWEGASASIALPSASGPLFWTFSSSSGKTLASGSIPGF